MAYHSKFTGAEVDSLLEKIAADDVGRIDSALSTTSTNPVTNKTITEELNKKATKTEVTESLNTKADKTEVDAVDTKLTELSAEIGEVSSQVEQDHIQVDKVKNFEFTEEEGLHIMDKDGNVAWSLIPMITEDGGLAFVDKDGNIGIKVDKGMVDVCGVGNNIKAIWGKDDIKLADTIAKMNAELLTLKNNYERIIEDSISIKENSSEIISEIEIPALPYDAENHVVRLGLHYGSQIGGKEVTEFNSNPYNDIFFDGKCRKDFGDVRILDADDNILPVRLEHHGNYECVRDTNYNSGAELFVNSYGYAVQGRDGGRLYLTKDDGKSWIRIPNQSKATTAAFIDSRDNLFYYVDGVAYIVLCNNGEYDFANSVEVLNMNKTNDIDNTDATISAIVEDKDGYIYLGQYQLNWNPVIFKSKNSTFTPVNGEYFSISYKQNIEYLEGDEVDYNKCDRHVHFISIDPYTKNIYAGLDNSRKAYGANLVKSTDNGATWNKIELNSVEWQTQRGRDYLATWFGKDFYVGGGEVNILGGYTLAKVATEIIGGNRQEMSIKGVLNTAQGVRKVINIEDDNFIVAGLNSSGINSPALLSLSTDNGETWKTIYHEDVGSHDSIGAGVRFFTPNVQLQGSDEPCVYVTGFNVGDKKYSSIRLYRGGEHYYGEMYVNVGKMVAGQPKTIKVANKYLMSNPVKMIYNRDVVKPTYSVFMNTGVSNKVVDSNGKTHTIVGNYEWDKFDNNMRFGVRTPFVQNGLETNGLLLKDGAYINLGKVEQLGFSKNFSIVLWMKQAERMQIIGADADYAKYKIMLKSDNGMSIFQVRAGYGVGQPETNMTRGSSGVTNFYDLYLPVCITFDGGNIPAMSVMTGDEQPIIQNYASAKTWDYDKLSQHDLYIGADGTSQNEINLPYYINRISFYDHVLTNEEMMSINKGYNF
jgi:hypothetical protein